MSNRSTTAHATTAADSGGGGFERHYGLGFASLVCLTVGTLVLPPLMMIVFGGLTDSEPGNRPNFTTATLHNAFGEPVVYQSLMNSLIYAVTTSVLAVVIGGALAWLVERTDGAPRSLVQLLSVVPVLLPAVVFCSAWIMLLNPTSGPINVLWKAIFPGADPLNAYSFGGMIFVGTLQELPLAFLWMWPAFRSMNPLLEESGLMSGASLFTVTRRITIPLLLPAILAALLICFITSLSALSVPLMMGVPGGIILYSTEVYFAITRIPSDLNLASAFCFLFLAMTLLSLYAYRRALGDTGRYAVVTGKAYMPRRIALGPWRVLTQTICYVVFLMLAVLPMFVIVWNAFMPFPQVPSLAGLARFTTGNFAAALNYGPAVRAVMNSLILGLAAGGIATMLGLAIAIVQQRSEHTRLANIADQLGTAPITFPGILVGVSLLWTFLTVPIPIYGTRWILLIAYVTMFLPYAVRSCNAALTQLHKELDEAALVSGASRVTAARRILLPLLAPSLLGSVLYIFLKTFREYSASIFLTAVGTEVFSVLVLDMWSGGNSNILAAYVVMVTAMLSVVALLMFRLSGRDNVTP